MRFTLSALFALFAFSASAQWGMPALDLVDKMDSIYVHLFNDQKKGDEKAIQASLDEITSTLNEIEQDYPLFAAVTQMHQLYYATDTKHRAGYKEKLVRNLKNSGTEVAERYSPQLFWLIEGFYLDNRMGDWLPVDSMIRTEMYKGKNKGGEKYIVSEFANNQLAGKKYNLANNLAKYDEIYFKYLNSDATYDKISLIFTQWIQLKQSLDQWLQTSYTDRTNLSFSFNEGQVIPDFLKDNSSKNEHAIDFKSAFERLFDGMKKLYPEMVKDNQRGKENYNQGYRENYFYLYNLFIQHFSIWAFNDHKIPEGILPVKKFLIEEVWEEEILQAKKEGQKPAIAVNDLKALVKSVANMYYHVGNAVQASEILMRGQKMIEDYPGISQDEFLLSLIELSPLRIRAARLEGDFSKAIRINQTLKKVVAKPDSLSKSDLNALEWFGESRVEEVFTLMAQHKLAEATDSLILLIDFVSGLPTDNEEIIYQTRLWTNLQYLTSLSNAERGTWNAELIQEMIADLLRNDQTTAEIFYPAQLMAIKAIWINEKKIHTGYLQNILFFTRRQLESNFILLSAEERMQMYGRNMNDYFDIYHELLFSGSLDSFPQIKQEVMSQSLYLKNALVDGNIIPDEVFLNDNSHLTKDLLEKVRDLRQSVKNNYLNAQLLNMETKGRDLNDQIQSIWLSYLTGENAVAMVRLKDWNLIAQKIKPGQVYLETVRYKRWLSDSAVVYGAYVIDDAKQLHWMNLCTEEALLKVLNEPGSSPQTASLTGTAKRGNELLGKNTKKPKSFKPGDRDLLGELLLLPIEKYIKGKKELIMVHDGLLNRISYAALQQNNRYLVSQIQIHQMSGSNEIGTQLELPAKGVSALLAGGLDYGASHPNGRYRLFVPELTWQYLPGTKSETAMLEPVFKKQGYQTVMLTGKDFPDSLGSTLSRYSFIHLATHGFYYDSITANQVFRDRYNRDAMQQEPLFRSGLAISGANSPVDTVSSGVKGYLMGYELANTDLRNCYLVSLSACETGLGDLRNNLGVDGLSRALKIAGAKHLLISLWKVPDEPTSVFMQLFYAELFSGKNPAAALRATQLTMSKDYPAAAWAAFILVE